MNERWTHDRVRVASLAAVPEGVGTPSGVPDVGRLTEILSGPLGDVAIQTLRVQPRQARSIESVERILSAAAEMAFRYKRVESISIEKISSRAGVTPQAVYRYFKDAETLVKTGLRCVVIREHERVIRLLSGHVQSDAAEMASVVVGSVLDTCERFRSFPAHIRDDVVREYVQIGHIISHIIPGLLCEGVSLNDDHRLSDKTKLSVALTAIIAIATSFVSREMFPLRGTRFEDMLTKLFISVIQSDGSLSDAFWEIGDEFEFYAPASIN